MRCSSKVSPSHPRRRTLLQERSKLFKSHWSNQWLTSNTELKANWIGWLSFISLSRFRVYWPLQTVRAFSAPGHLLCRLLTPTVCSEAITDLSVPCTPRPAGTYRRSPGVSSCAFGAQPLDLRLWSLMDMDFVLSCALVRPQRLLSSFCSSARTCDTRFFQTSPHGDALALLSPSPPSGWQRDLHPPSAGTCPAHMKSPRSKLRGITRKGIVCETPRFLTLFPL